MRVSSANFLKQYGALSDRALSEPVIITRNGRDRLVLMSAQAFERMARHEPRARVIEELDDAELEMIAASRVPEGYDDLNSLLDE